MSEFQLFGSDTGTEIHNRKHGPGPIGTRSVTGVNGMPYCIWPPEGIRQKCCDHCAAHKMVCTIGGIQVSNRKWWDWSGEERLWSKKKSWVEVEAEAELERSRTGGWRQEVSAA